MENDHKFVHGPLAVTMEGQATLYLQYFPNVMRHGNLGTAKVDLTNPPPPLSLPLFPSLSHTHIVLSNQSDLEPCSWATTEFFFWTFSGDNPALSSLCIC